jgi:hypothetical protein
MQTPGVAGRRLAEKALAAIGAEMIDAMSLPVFEWWLAKTCAEYQPDEPSVEIPPPNSQLGSSLTMRPDEVLELLPVSHRGLLERITSGRLCHPRRIGLVEVVWCRGDVEKAMSDLDLMRVHRRWSETMPSRQKGIRHTGQG